MEYMQFLFLLTVLRFADALVPFIDDLGRNKMLPLAAAAYSDTPQQCLTNRIGNAVVKRQLTVSCDGVKKTTCSGYTAVNHNHTAIVISFRGSVGGMQDLIEGLEALEKKDSFIGGGKVSKYFNAAWLAVWQAGMKDDLLTLKTAYPTYKLWVTGHSLGGSMASIAAAYIVQTDIYTSDKVTLVTFGQPRTGDKDYAAAHERIVPCSYRVIHHRDMIPHLPPDGLEGYRHHANEIFYDNDMNEGDAFKTCVGGEDKHCADQFFRLSSDDHDQYYGENVSDYGEAGCSGHHPHV